ncbi:MAG: ABC transporter substrate-binding protein [Ignisphaera sp.]|uniref:Extracellular solute-binding protein n=1 Tax=Ignisphaera aggregans TaxID=334771 RepID=A0A7J3N098_9CREN
MRKNAVLMVVAIVVILGIALFGIYNIIISPGRQETSEVKQLKPISLKIMSTWSQWGCDDFNRYFFAESGMPRVGVVLPSASMRLNITNISFIRIEDPKVWKAAGINGSVDGFIGQNRYNITILCREGALHPIDDPEILALARDVPELLKGYTDDGRLCWIAMFFVPYTWLVNTDYANKYGLEVPSSWIDLIKPEYVAVITKGGNVVAAYPVTNRAPMMNTVNTLLSKYGWEKGWTLISVIFGSISRLETGTRQARDSISFGKALLTVLEFGDAYTAYSMFPDKLRIIFPRNETGFWFTPIAIAARTTDDGLEGMYRLIRWVLTEAQDKMFLNRTGWSFYIPVLGYNNTNPRIIYRDPAITNLYASPVNMELVLGEAAPAIALYGDTIIADQDVRELLRIVVNRIVEKYINREIVLEEYYRYLDMVGQPVEFIDPLTGGKTVFTLDKARELGNAIRNNSVDIEKLRSTFKDAIISKLNILIQNLG